MARVAGKRKSRFKGSVSRNVAKQQQGRGSQHLRLPKGVSLFKEQAKTRVTLDIIPYVVSDERHPDRDDEFQIALPGEIWYKRPYWIHRNIGPNKESVICLSSVGQRCPICDYRQELIDDGADWNDDSVKALRATQRNLYVVIPRGHRDYEEVPHIWDISQFLFQNALNEEVEENEEYETFPDPVEGYSLQIRFSEEQFGSNKYAATSRIDFVQRKVKMDDSIIDQAPDLDKVLIIPTQETVEQIFFGGVGASGNDSDTDNDDADHDYDDDEEETPRRRPSRTTRKQEEVEDDYDPDDAPFDTGDTSDEQEDVEQDGDAPDDNPDSEPESPPPTRQRSRARKGESDECPAGHMFGTDVDQHPECDDCPIWEKCMDAFEKLQG